VASGAQPHADDRPPRPRFDRLEARLAYLHWLATESERLKAFTPEHPTRVEFLEATWYESRRAGIEPALVLALIENASKFRKYAIGASGARGFMQVAESWSKTIGDGDSSKLFHMQTNLRFGCVLVRHYMDTSNGDVTGALAMYYGQMTGRPKIGTADPAGRAFAQRVLVSRAKWAPPE
jgi:soluble lytic murein transglycosylase-like protein